MFSLPLALLPGGAPLYEQIYTYIVEEVSAGRLAAGEKLPSKRALAGQLNVSVNTVDTAYQMLVAEGYADARPKSGFFVAQLDAFARHKMVNATIQPSAPAAPFTEGGSEPAVRYSFSTGGVDTALFPRKTWTRLRRELLAQQDNPLLNMGDSIGDENLRCAIAGYLHDYRGVRCTPQQIVVGAGNEYLAGQLALLLRNSTFALEDPGYARIGSILHNNGVRAVYVPVDEDGMVVTALEQSGADVAYVTPSHQFPTGVTMPVPRRQQLLQWASAKDGRYVIEDDFDSEFRFSTRPVPAMQGWDADGHIIYVGTFSKSIAPGIRMAYMVLPQRLLASYNEMFRLYSCTVSRIEQQTVCRFIEGGFFARHLRRLRKAYRARRDALVEAIYAELGNAVEIRGAHTGLHLLVCVPWAKSEAWLVESAAAQGVQVGGFSAYCHTVAPMPNTVVLGYASMTPQQLREAVHLLGKVWRPAK